jgi:hypothetical protein
MNMKRGLGFECEWKVDFNKLGKTVKQYRHGHLQFSYFISNQDDHIQHLSVRSHHTQCLSRELLSLLSNNSINFFGVNVGGDLARIGHGFGTEKIISTRK